MTLLIQVSIRLKITPNPLSSGAVISTNPDLVSSQATLCLNGTLQWMLSWEIYPFTILGAFTSLCEGILINSESVNSGFTPCRCLRPYLEREHLVFILMQSDDDGKKKEKEQKNHNRA